MSQIESEKLRRIVNGESNLCSDSKIKLDKGVNLNWKNWVKSKWLSQIGNTESDWIYKAKSNHNWWIKF